jgi:hypothetical protein
VWIRRRGTQTADCPVISSLGELVAIIDGTNDVSATSGGE